MGKAYKQNRLFLSEEEGGTDIIEFMSLLAIAAVLIAIAAGVGKQMKSTGQNAASEMSTTLNSLSF